MKKNEFIDLLDALNMSKKEFAKIADVPYSTVTSWGASRNGRVLEIPNWVRQLLYYYDKSQKLDYVTDEICEKLILAKKSFDVRN